MSSPDFKKLWQEMDWYDRSHVLDMRRRAFYCLGEIDSIYDYIQVLRAQHKSTREYKKRLKEWMDQLEEWEYQLQVVWGVKKDSKYHTYWLAPKACTCPKMDNADHLGYGRIIAGDCPLHGSHPCWKTKGK